MTSNPNNPNNCTIVKNLIVTILEKIVPNVVIENNPVFIFPDPRRETRDFIDEYFVRSFLNRNKFDALNDQLKNIFLTSEKREINLNHFMQAQKIYWIFKRFGRKIYVKNHVKDSPHTVDITLTPLDHHPDSLKVKFIQKDILYTFFVNDLIKIINSSLTYAPDLFSEPTEPKNPYINLPFTISNLFSIYSFIANSNKVMPKLLHAYFLCDFSIPKFHIEYESLIREEVLKKHYDDASNTKLYNDIIIMLRRNKRYCRSLRIHPEFDKSLVIKEFRCMLEHNLITQFSYQPTKRLFSKRLIRNYLERFVERNPIFGRVTITCFGFSTRSSMTTSSTGFIQPTLTYSVTADLLDSSLSDEDNVFDLIEQLETVERISARRIIRARRPLVPAPPPPPPSTAVSLIIDDVEDDVEDDIEDDFEDDIEDNVEDDVEDDIEDDVEDDAVSADIPPALEIIGTGISNLDLTSGSSYIDNGTNTIISRYVSSRTDNSSGARIEYTTHSSSNNVYRSSYTNNNTNFNNSFNSDLTRSLEAIDNAITNMYNTPTPPVISNAWSSQIANNNTISDSNFNITETSNSTYDATLNVLSDSEIDTPTSHNTEITNPFIPTHPDGFNPVHNDSDDNMDIDSD